MPVEVAAGGGEGIGALTAVSAGWRVTPFPPSSLPRSS